MSAAPASTFRGDVMRLTTGTGIAQLLGIAATPVVTRLFAPEAYGVAAVFIAVSGLLGVLACLRYELSIVVAEDDGDAANLLIGCLGLTALVAFALVSLVAFVGPHTLATLNLGTLEPFLWLLPAAVFVHGVYLALNYWNTRTRHYRRLAAAQVSSKVVGVGGTLGAGFAGHATGGAMIVAGLAGQAAATAVLGAQIWRDDGRLVLRAFRWSRLTAVLRRHRKFPLVSSWSGLMNEASWQMPLLMFGIFFSPAVVGYYALGFRIIKIPMSLIGGSIRRVFLDRAARARDDGTLAPLVESLFKRMAQVSFFPALLLTLAGRDLYVFAFGANWAEAGVYSQILGLWAFMWFLASPIGNLTNVLGKQEVNLVVNVLLMTTRIGAIVVGGHLGSPHIALALFAGTGILIYAGYFGVLMRLSDARLTVIVRTFADTAVRAAIWLAPAAIAKLSAPDQPLVLVAVAAVSGALFAIHSVRLLRTNGPPT